MGDNFYYRCPDCGCKFTAGSSNASTFIPFYVVFDMVAKNECPECGTQADIISSKEYYNDTSD